MKKFVTLLILITITLISAQFSYAQRGIDPSLKPINAPDIPVAGPSEQECIDLGGKRDKNAQLCSGYEDVPISAFIQIIAGAILMISGGVGVIVISVGGVLYITSRGNEQQLNYAKSTLLYGVIGMVVIIFSYFIVSWVLKLVIGA